MKPMLARSATCTPEELKEVLRTTPLIVTPKMDGVRALCRMAEYEWPVYSRKLLPIPNTYVQEILRGWGRHGMDGELIVGDPTAPDVFNVTTSFVMSDDDKDTRKFWFHVFDLWHMGDMYSYEKRVELVQKACEMNMFCTPVPTVLCKEYEQIEQEMQRMRTLGYEGLILRSPHRPYKFGRSTLGEAGMLKLKDWEDSEGVILSVIEGMTNTNEATKDELGHTKRSSAKAGKIGKGTCGAMMVRDDKHGWTFSLPAGPTMADCDRLWLDRATLPGKLVKYKFQPHGSKNKPRFPGMIGLRDERDT